MSTEVVMPQMGESIAEGTITKWMKNVGDHVDRDEPLFEISTDKVDAEIPSPAAGTLTEIRFKEGETVEVNTVVAVLDGDGAQPAAKPEASAPVKESAPTTTESSPPESPVAPPAAVERPKPVITTTERGAPTAAAPPPPAHKTEVKPLVKKSEPTPAAPPRRADDSTASAEELRRTKSSPLVRKIAEEHGIDIKSLEGTGMSGRVTKNDILSFIESGASPQAPATSAKPASSQLAPPAPPAGAPGTLQPPATKPTDGDRVEQMSV